jgi:hypothetical protein
MRGMQPDPSTAEQALDEAERKGFWLAVIGRTCALVAIAVFYLTALRYPNNIYVAGLVLGIAGSALRLSGLSAAAMSAPGATRSTPSTRRRSAP